MRTLVLALVLFGSLGSVDLRVRDAVQQARAPALEPVMRGASNLGKPAVVLGGLLAVAVIDPAGVAVARAGLLAVLPVNLAVEILKRGVHRVRPDGDRNPVNSSFPSSHAANAFALAVVFSRRWPKGSPWFGIGAAIIAFSRVYLNRHYFTDVLVGAVLGTLLAWWMPALLSSALVRLAGRFRRGGSASRAATRLAGRDVPHGAAHRRSSARRR